MSTTAVDARSMCLSLMKADTEADVVKLLTDAGYWNDSNAWRLFSDDENSFAVIGNQQAEAIAALVEKVINSVDARLANACLLADCDPEGADAPQSMREAVARFFEGKQDPKASDGRIAEWTDDKATEEGRLLTVAATGHMPQAGRPCLTVADQGEGQTPDTFPDTFMSIQRNNKLRIPFVQGKFNMGGTGVFQFSTLQLVVSRRNPAFLTEDCSARDREWGFTVVRREFPTGGSRSSVFRYLAPVSVPGTQLGGVLSFAADDWPIFPESDAQVRDAYHRRSAYGSLIKLYEYDWQGTKSNIVFSGDGLLRRLDIGLPELALPVRVFECREKYKGHHGSFATNALGLVARLDADREGNLEGDGPIGGVITLDDGKQIRLRVYVFRDKDKAKSYRSTRHGVVFGVNGQMHAAYSTDFFARNSVSLSYLKDSLLVFADCTDIEGQTREDLFMNSRDRLRVNPASKQLEEKLTSLLRHHPTLREIQNRRRHEATEERLGDDKPLSEVLERLMKANPVLNQLFLRGVNISAPFPPTPGTNGHNEQFVGKRFPTFFHFKGRKAGEVFKRTAHLGSRVRIAFTTDAEDSYFVRDIDPGAWSVKRRVGDNLVDATGWMTTGPKSGIAQLMFDSLPDEVSPGDRLAYVIEVTDPSRVDAFRAELQLEIVGETDRHARNGGRGSNNANSGKGNHGGEGSTLTLPNIIPVRRESWGRHEFDESSALKVVHVGAADDPEAPVYDFYVNTENKFLLHSFKQRGAETAVLEKQFTYGLVLVGLALLQEHHRQKSQAARDREDIETVVLRTSRALGPILLPMIQTMGTLDWNESR